MNNTRAWILVIGILLILAITAFVVLQTLQNAVNRTVSPVQSMTSNLGTRVAEILNPTPTIVPDPVSVIREIRSLARLETIQYTVEKVITAETGQGPLGFLFGDRLLLVAHGFVIAGVDLEKLTPDDLRIEQGVLYVGLPESEVFVTNLDNTQSYVYDRDRGLLTKGDLNLEAAARQAAEEKIFEAALEDGILDLARQNAENYLYRLFRQLGFPEVIFE